jgi:hypothetical protein
MEVSVESTDTGFIERVVLIEILEVLFIIELGPLEPGPLIINVAHLKPLGGGEGLVTKVAHLVRLGGHIEELQLEDTPQNLLFVCSQSEFGLILNILIIPTTIPIILLSLHLTTPIYIGGHCCDLKLDWLEVYLHISRALLVTLLQLRYLILNWVAYHQTLTEV